MLGIQPYWLSMRGRWTFSKCMFERAMHASEGGGTEIAVHQQSVKGLHVEGAGLEGTELQTEQLGSAFVEEEVVAAVDEGGIEGLRLVAVQTVVGEVHHVLHAEELDAGIFDGSGIVGQSETQGIHVLEVFAAHEHFDRFAGGEPDGAVLGRGEGIAVLCGGEGE